MGLLYCGANIQPTAAAEVCDDGRSLYNTEGGIFRTQCSILRDYQPVWLLYTLRFVILGTFGFFWGGTFPLPVILDIFSSGIKKLWKIKGFLLRLSSRPAVPRPALQSTVYLSRDLSRLHQGWIIKPQVPQSELRTTMKSDWMIVAVFHSQPQTVQSNLSWHICRVLQTKNLNICRLYLKMKQITPV